MATRNTNDSKRFTYRTPAKESEAFFIPADGSEPTVLPKRQQSTTPTPTNDEKIPARRVVVIRNTKNQQLGKGPVDLNDFSKSNTRETAPIVNVGNKSIYLLRRPINKPESLEKPIQSNTYNIPRSPEQYNSPEPPQLFETSNFFEGYHLVSEPLSPMPMENIRTPTPPEEPIVSPVQQGPLSPPPQSPTIHSIEHQYPIPVTTRPVKSERYAPYLRRSQLKLQNFNPNHMSSVDRSPSPKQKQKQAPRRKHRVVSPESVEPVNSQYHPSSPPYQGDYQNIDASQGFYSITTVENNAEPYTSHSATIMQDEDQPEQYRHIQSTQRSAKQKLTSARPKSAKSVILLNPDDQSIAVVENTFLKGESMRPAIKRSKSMRKSSFQDEFDNGSDEQLVKTSRPQRCLACLSRHMCLILIICFTLIFIGLAGAAVSAYFLATASSTSLTAKIVGIVVGALLAIAALCFLCILLACIGSHDGYFTYNDDSEKSGGRALALIPPSHPNAHSYIPHDYMRMVEQANLSAPIVQHIPPTKSSNTTYEQPTFRSAMSHTTKPKKKDTPRVIANEYQFKTDKSNITIEMPERLLTGRKVSPRTRERSLNKVVKNIGNIVEDTRIRHKGDVPNKVIVKIDDRIK